MATFDKYHKPITVGDRVRWRTYDLATKTAGYKFGTVVSIHTQNRKETLTVATVATWKDLVARAQASEQDTVLARLTTRL